MRKSIMLKSIIVLTALIALALCVFALYSCTREEDKDDGRFRHTFIKEAYSESLYVNIVPGETEAQEVSQAFWVVVVLNK